MADRVLFISCGTLSPAARNAGSTFNDAMGICGRMKQEGRLEKFDVVLLRRKAS